MGNKNRYLEIVDRAVENNSPPQVNTLLNSYYILCIIKSLIKSDVTYTKFFFNIVAALMTYGDIIGVIIT